jgi:hypothetical protein
MGGLAWSQVNKPPPATTAPFNSSVASAIPTANLPIAVTPLTTQVPSVTQQQPSVNPFDMF